MIENSPLQKRKVLKSYEQQLMMARRLARLKVKMRLAEGLMPEDPDPSIRRQGFVKAVARELFDSMIFTGNENPVVEEIRRELSRALKKEVEFAYPAGGRLCIVAREATGPRSLTASEQLVARGILENITSDKVEKSMLDKPGPVAAFI